MSDYNLRQPTPQRSINLLIKFIAITKDPGIFARYHESVYAKIGNYICSRLERGSASIEYGQRGYSPTKLNSVLFEEPTHTLGDALNRRIFILFHDYSSYDENDIVSEFGVMTLNKGLKKKLLIISSKDKKIADDLQGIGWPYFIFVTEDIASKQSLDELAFARYLTILQASMIKNPKDSLINCHNIALNLAFPNKPIGERPTLHTREDIDDKDLCLENFE